MLDYEDTKNMSIKEKKEEVATLATEVDTVKATWEEENRKPTKKEYETVKSKVDRIKQLKAEIEKEEPQGETQRPGFLADKPKAEKKEFYNAGERKDVKAMFRNEEKPTSNGGFKSFGEFVQNVARNGEKLYSKEFKATMTEGVPSDGGFMVPTEFSDTLIQDVLDNSFMMNNSTIFPLERPQMKKAVWFADDYSSNVGGITAYWTGEASAITESDAELMQLNFDCKKLAILTNVSNELLRDGDKASADIEAILKAAIKSYIDYYLLSQGSGGGQPLSLLNSACAVTVSGEDGQTADSIDYANVKKMFARQLNKGKGTWITNDDCLPELMELTIPVGTGGTFYPVLKENSGSYSIFGRPLYTNQNMPTLGDAGDLVLADMSKYAIGLLQNITIASTGAYKFNQDITTFRVIVRLDAMNVMDSAVTPRKSANTLSPVVKLGARA
jgi:HK97 family phage major capsid protein